MKHDVNMRNYSEGDKNNPATVEPGGNQICYDCSVAAFSHSTTISYYESIISQQVYIALQLTCIARLPSMKASVTAEGGLPCCGKIPLYLRHLNLYTFLNHNNTIVTSTESDHPNLKKKKIEFAWGPSQF